MERNNYRNQLQNGFINPSDDLWEKLHQKLDVHDLKQKRSKLSYLKYAVSFALIITMGAYLIPTKNSIEPNQNDTSKQLDRTSVKPLSNELNSSITPLENSENKIAKSQTPIKDEFERKTHIIQDNHNDVSAEAPKNLIQIASVQNSEDLLVKVTEKVEISLDHEVEELLKLANLNLEKNTRGLNSKNHLALDLLGEVENDLKRDHRRKLFEKITISIKSPSHIELADRNK